MNWERGEFDLFWSGISFIFCLCSHMIIGFVLFFSLVIIVIEWPCLVLSIEIILVPQGSTRPADSIRWVGLRDDFLFFFGPVPMKISIFSAGGFRTG